MSGDIFDLLDKSIDDLKDLPSFTVPATGIYNLSVSMEGKAINDKPALIAHFIVRAVVELEDSSIPEEDRAKAGDKFDMAFFLKDNDGNDSEIGWGRVKEFLKPFEVHFNEKNIRTLVQQHMSSAVDITAKVVKKQRKDDKDKYEARVSDVTID